jgi:hypothetical protein
MAPAVMLLRNSTHRINFENQRLHNINKDRLYANVTQSARQANGTINTPIGLIGRCM